MTYEVVVAIYLIAWGLTLAAFALTYRKEGYEIKAIDAFFMFSVAGLWPFVWLLLAMLAISFNLRRKT